MKELRFSDWREALSGLGLPERRRKSFEIANGWLETTQIYTHVLKRSGMGVKSPLDG